jgi:acyl-CoA thioesterase-2
VIAQSLMAAYETVEARICHSLHCYFIRPGDPSIPIIFEVDRSRDGGSFTTRRVIAVQKGRQIFNLAASFQQAESGLEHQAPMPEAPDWASVPTDAERRRAEGAAPEPEDDDPDADPLEIRRVGGRSGTSEPDTRDARQQVWIRAKDPLPAEQRLQQVVLAYLSDMTLLGTALRPHGVSWEDLQSASLDHAMWFHRPIDANGWHLFSQDSPSASGGRGMNLGYLFDARGALVATCAQEGLMRLRKPQA